MTKDVVICCLARFYRTSQGSTEQRQNDGWRGDVEEIRMFQCHFVHHKSRTQSSGTELKLHSEKPASTPPPSPLAMARLVLIQCRSSIFDNALLLLHYYYYNMTAFRLGFIHCLDKNTKFEILLLVRQGPLATLSSLDQLVR